MKQLAVEHKTKRHRGVYLGEALIRCGKVVLVDDARLDYHWETL